MQYTCLQPLVWTTALQWFTCVRPRAFSLSVTCSCSATDLETSSKLPPERNFQASDWWKLNMPRIRSCMEYCVYMTGSQKSEVVVHVACIEYCYVSVWMILCFCFGRVRQQSPFKTHWVCIFTFLQTVIDFLQWMAVRYSHKFSLSYLQTARTWQASKYLLCPFKTSLSIGWFSSRTRQVNARSRGIHMESNTSFEELLRRVESGAYLLGLLVAKVLFTCFGSWTLDTMCYTSEKKEDGISNRPHTVILFFCLDLFHRQCLNRHL